MRKLKYEIITEIKKTEKSKVYLAAVEGYDFPVILKEIIHGDIQVFRYLMEITCEQLPQIFYAEERNEGILVVEEYAEGEPLSAYLSEGKLTEDRCFDIAEQICSALKVLHHHTPALIHRDIKPSNIMLSSQNKVKVIDFDSTRLYKEESDTDTRFLGTEKYAAPEQYGYSQTDCRSDIYSLGVVLEKFTVFMTSKKQKQWKQLVEKCTFFSPDHRFQNIMEVEQKIKDIRAGRSRRRSVQVAVGLFVLGVFIAVYVGILQSGNTQNVIGFTESAESTEWAESTEQAEFSEQTDATEQAEYIEQAEDAENIPPEWRVIPTDDAATVELKKEIQENGAVVLYYFKNRMQDRDFLFQIKDLSGDAVTLQSIKVSSVNGKMESWINASNFEVEHSVVSISKNYMNILPEGYYFFEADLRRVEGGPYHYTMLVYVSPEDNYEEEDMWFINTTFEYTLHSNEKVHVVLKNDCQKDITVLYQSDGSIIDTSMYEIKEDGRVLEISNELLDSFASGEQVCFYVECRDGSYLDIGIMITE